MGVAAGSSFQVGLPDAEAQGRTWPPSTRAGRCNVSGSAVVGCDGTLAVLGTATVANGGSLALRSMDCGGFDLAQIGAGGTFTAAGSVLLGYDTTFTVLGTAAVATGSLLLPGGRQRTARLRLGRPGRRFTVGSGGTMGVAAGGSFQVGLPDAEAQGENVATIDAGGTLNVSGSAVVGCDGTFAVLGTATVASGGTFALRNMDSGGCDLAQIDAGGTFTAAGSVLLGYDTAFTVLGTAAVATGGSFQVGDNGLPGFDSGDPERPFTVGSGGTMGIAAGGSFQVGLRSCDRRGGPGDDRRRRHLQPPRQPGRAEQGPVRGRRRPRPAAHLDHYGRGHLGPGDRRRRLGHRGHARSDRQPYARRGRDARRRDGPRRGPRRRP